MLIAPHLLGSTGQLQDFGKRALNPRVKRTGRPGPVFGDPEFSELAIGAEQSNAMRIQESLGFHVKGEIGSCDLVGIATRSGLL